MSSSQPECGLLQPQSLSEVSSGSALPPFMKSETLELVDNGDLLLTHPSLFSPSLPDSLHMSKWRVDFQLEQLQSPRVSVGRHIARLGMIGGDDGFGYVLPGILMENDSDTDPEDSLDTGYCLQSSIKSEYDLELESRIKMEIPDSCSEFFTLDDSCSAPGRGSNRFGLEVSSVSSLAAPPSPDTLQCSSTTISSTFNKDLIKEEDDCSKRPCLVCGDIASGYHYGVSSCEACKAFFKRTIQGNIEYTCPVNNNCEINKRRRKACQACRYQKCIRQGMLKEGVRLDRVRGGRQKYRRYSIENCGGPGMATMSNVRKVSLEENKILVSLAGSEPDSLLATADTPTQTLMLPPGLRIVSLLADLYDRELVATIGWAKQVPGFTDLTLNDQMKLLQNTWTEVLTLSLLFRSLPKTGKLNFAADLSLNETEASQCGLEMFYEKCMILLDRLDYIGLCKEEFLLLKAVVLANSDCSMEDKTATEHLRESLLSSLQDVIHCVRSTNTNLQLEKLLLILPCLRHVDTLIRMFWARIKQEGQVTMNKLLIEMLES